MRRSLLLTLLLALTAAQPPRPGGPDAEELKPLRPPRTPGTEDRQPPLPPPPSGALPPAPDRPKHSPAVAFEPPCRKLKCRDLTGRCTAHTPSWGEARRPQLSYLKGHSSKVPTGQSLRSARELSNLLSDQKAETANSHGLNELFVFFGQFIDHNLISTPAEGDPLPILVPDDDPVFPPGTKLPFTRSTRGLTGEGDNERPINVLSSALDLSAVYGVSPKRNRALLELDAAGLPTGKLKTSPGDLLPLNTAGFHNAPNTGNRFYLAGDHRANEHPALTALHTIFLREHNRLCDKIKVRLGFLSGMKVYEYARKINIAQFQKIVYEEFYPAMIAKRLPKYKGFRRNVNPTISDIFAGAAFRVGHTMVSGTVSRLGPDGVLDPIPMAEMLFRPAPISSAEIANVIRGTVGTLAQEVDLQVKDVLRNLLFDKVDGEDGFDLVALNIQRGRDHALPTFNEIRRIFGIPSATSFGQISSDPSTAAVLSNAYGSNVDDVEAWVGMVAEDKVRRSGIGRTMAAVWRAEFLRLRDGDQFFYLRRNKIPRVIRKRLSACVRDILKRKKKLFREIIIRNTDISSTQLPPGDIFKL